MIKELCLSYTTTPYEFIRKKENMMADNSQQKNYE